MIGNSYLSKHFKERNFHGGTPVVISGIAFLVLPTAIFRGGVVAGFIMLIIAAAGAWAVHGPLWCVFLAVACMRAPGSCAIVTCFKRAAVACRSWPASFLVGPAKSAGIACYNACGAAGGFVGPYLIGETCLCSCRAQRGHCRPAQGQAFVAGYLSDRYGGFAPPMYLLGAFNVLAGLMIIGACCSLLSGKYTAYSSGTR